MAKSAIPCVWDAVMAVLNDPSIAALGYSVFDFVPQGNSTDRYLRPAAPTENRLDTFGKAGKRVTVQVHVYTSTAAYAGSADTQAVLSVISGLFNYAALNLNLNGTSGFSLISCRPEDAHDVGDEDINGVTWKHYVQMLAIEVMEL